MMHEAPTPVVESNSSRRGRLFALLSTGLLLMGICVAGLAVSRAGSAADRDQELILAVDDLITPAPPSTVSPIAALPDAVVPDTAPDGAPDEPGATAATSTTVVTAPDDGLSPLASRLGRQLSTIPEFVEPRPRPLALSISSIDTTGFPIRDVGLDEAGELEVPDETEIGWYRYGATAGQPGATVLAAHVSWNNTTGPFFRLGRVEPGDQISVTLDNGTERRYEVVERTMYGKSELPRERIWRNTGDETLVLITCGGDFNPEIRRYLQNIVVYAVPVG